MIKVISDILTEFIIETKGAYEINVILENHPSFIEEHQDLSDYDLEHLLYERKYIR